MWNTLVNNDKWQVLMEISKSDTPLQGKQMAQSGLFSRFKSVVYSYKIKESSSLR